MKPKHLDLNRKTILKGMGATLPLPWLETMSWGAEKQEQQSQKVVYLFNPNGAHPSSWTCQEKDKKLVLTNGLAPLQNYSEKITVFSNLYNRAGGGGDAHKVKVASWLSGTKAHVDDQGKLSNGISVDQVLAQHWKGSTPFGSLELSMESCGTGVDGMGVPHLFGGHISWREGGKAIPRETQPGLAFTRLFKSGMKPQEQMSVIDAVLGDLKQLTKTVSKRDKHRLDEYSTSLREFEKTLELKSKHKVKIPNEGGFAKYKNLDEHFKQMFDLMVLALETNQVRVASLMLGQAGSNMNFSFLPGVKGTYHQLSHHANEPGKVQQYASITKYLSSKLSYFLKQLKQKKEGPLTLLDSTSVVLGSSIQDGNKHNLDNVPTLVCGGPFGMGRCLKLKPKTPLSNLHLSMINRLGVPMNKFGESTGAIDEIMV